MDNRVVFLDMLSEASPFPGYESRKDQEEEEHLQTDVFLSEPSHFSMRFLDWEEEKETRIITLSLGEVDYQDQIIRLADWLSVKDNDYHLQISGWDLKRTVIPNLKLELMKLDYEPNSTLLKRFDRRPFEDYWALDLRDKVHMNWRVSMNKSYGYGLQDMCTILGYEFQPIEYAGLDLEHMELAYEIYYGEKGVRIEEEEEIVREDFAHVILNRRMDMVQFVYDKIRAWK